MKNLLSALFAFFLITLFLLKCDLVSAQAEPQEQTPPVDQSQPKPAARSTFPVVDLNAPADQNQDMRADFNPLAGLLTATLGAPGLRHSYWLAGLQFGSSVQSAPINGSGSNGWFADNYFLGNLSLLKAWSRSEFAVNYSGGGFVSTESNAYGAGSGNFQQLSLSQTFHTSRWLIQATDLFSYAPQSTFGFGAGTNLGVPGVGGSWGSGISGINGSVLPNQSIYATNGPVYSNMGLLQATYSVSPRGSITVAGAYGILRFVEPGNFDQDSIVGSVGYNYILTRKDTIGVVYLFTAYHYQGQPQAFGSHSISAAYSRKITGRLALQLYGGPQISTYRVPIGDSTQQVGFYTSANLNYATHGGSISGGYVHGLSGGSGVLVGSNIDQINLYASRNLGRVWVGNVNFGYSHNSPLNGSAQPTSSTYNTWFAGAGVNRAIGHSIYFGVAYAAYISKFGNSTNNTGSTTYTTNSINISLQWHTRPYVLD